MVKYAYRPTEATILSRFTRKPGAGNCFQRTTPVGNLSFPSPPLSCSSMPKATPSKAELPRKPEKPRKTQDAALYAQRTKEYKRLLDIYEAEMAEYEKGQKEREKAKAVARREVAKAANAAAKAAKAASKSASKAATPRLGARCYLTCCQAVVGWP